VIIQLVAKGDEEAAARLHAMGDRAHDARPLWNEIAPILLRAEDRKFARKFTKSVVIGERLTLRRFSRTSGGELHSVKQRKRTVYSLVKSGRLKKSLVTFRAPGQKLDVQPHELVYGTDVFYAKFLRRRGFRIIQIDKAGRAEINAKVTDYLAGR
jgi:hypothetical protein